MDVDKIAENIKKRQEEHDRIWNAAIEASLTIVKQYVGEADMTLEIRKLKK